MTPRILRIEDAGPQRKARRLVFDDGSDFRVTSAAVVKSLALAEGADVDPDSLEVALCQSEGPLAKERALRLLGYRDRSTAELTRKLADSGYPNGLVTAVVSRLAELGLVDDVRFSSAWTRSRLAAGIGSRRIARELAEKGIAPEVAACALDAECPEDDQLFRAVRALRGQSPSDRKGRDRLVRRLVGKGYDLSTAIQAVDSASVSGSPDSEE